jgi:type VI secretion system protein VasG
LPDKAVDLLDTCAARVAIAQDAKPPELQDLERDIQIKEREQAALQRDISQGDGDERRLEVLSAELTSLRDSATELEQRWQKQRELVVRLGELRAQLSGGLADSSAGDELAAEPAAEASADEPKKDASFSEDPSRDASATEQSDKTVWSQLEAVQQELAALQENEVLVPVDVSPDLVAAVVSDWTGIPAGKMVKDEAETLLELDKRLSERIKGQRSALRAISQAIRSSKLGLARPETPIGVFLLVGPSGVGKTESGLALADLLFGGERFVVTINMSEFQEKHTVSRLIGSPPGYVGYGEGGVLTEAVRQRPYTVVLLDEVEKADPEVMNLFYQVFDKGRLSDGEGRVIDFRNTVVMMTSNLGSDVMTEMCTQVPPPKKQEVTDAVRPILSKHFKPALLARMTLVPYFPLGASAMHEIVDLKLGKLRERVEQTHAVNLAITDKVPTQIVARCAEVETGARNIDHIMEKTLLPLLSRALLGQMSSGQLPDQMTLDIDESGEFELLASVPGAEDPGQ